MSKKHQGKVAGLVDRVLHPGSHAESENAEKLSIGTASLDPGLAPGEAAADPQSEPEPKSHQKQGGAEPSPAAKSQKARKSGRANPAADYQEHPKFAKFKGRT